jgi:hypothetical protein
MYKLNTEIAKSSILMLAKYATFFVVLRPNVDHGFLILEVSISHTTTHYSR